MVTCLLFMIKLEMLVFDKRRKPDYLGKNLSEQEQKPPLFLCFQTPKVFFSFSFWNFIHHYVEPWARMYFVNRYIFLNYISFFFTKIPASHFFKTELITDIPCPAPEKICRRDFGESGAPALDTLVNV